MPVKFSGLPASTQANLTDVLAKSDQGGVPSQRMTVAQLATLLASTTGGGTVFSGNYAGAAPGFSPSASAAIAFDTSNGAQWAWWSSAWH